MKTLFIIDSFIYSCHLGRSMEPSSLLAHLFDKKKIAVLKVFLDSPERELTMLEVAKSSRVSNATTFRLLQKLVTLEILEEHKLKHLKTYILSKNQSTKYLERILEVGKSALEEFIESLKSVRGVEEVILHGKKKKERADILIIGRDVDSGEVQSIINTILEKYKFTIVHLTLDPDQYKQMLSMGLYSGIKEELYKAPTTF